MIALIPFNQSHFQQVDSRIYQLLSIKTEIYKSFDSVFEFRGIFLNKSKAYDKI